MTTGSATTPRTATAATPSSTNWVVRRNRSGGCAADETADAGAEQHREQCDVSDKRVAEQQDEPLKQRHLDSSESRASMPTVREP